MCWSRRHLRICCIDNKCGDDDGDEDDDDGGGGQAGREPHPEVVPGVAGVSGVVDEAVPSIVSLRQRHAQLGIDVLHELSAVMHRLQSRGREGEKMITSTSLKNAKKN